MPMNLLPWREALAKQKICTDGLFICVLAALVALVLEIGLGSFSCYSAYFTWQIKKLEEKLLQQQNDYKTSAALQQQLTMQRQNLIEIQRNQTQWKNSLRMLQAIESQKPTALTLLHIQMEKDNWQIQGNAQSFAAVENYQQSLNPFYKNIEITKWQPTTNKIVANFELTLKP